MMEEIVLKDPSIQEWTNLIKFRNILDDVEMARNIIQLLTGWNKELIDRLDDTNIADLSTKLTERLNQSNKEIYKSIEHNGKKYKLVDTNKITFGQFVDIDSFMTKDEKYKLDNLHEVAAYLYSEEGTKYSDSNFDERIEEMKSLPIKYVESSLFFFSNIKKELPLYLGIYSKIKMMLKVMRGAVLVSIGAGIQLFRLLLRTKFGRLILLLIYPLYLVSTTWRMLWTSIVKRIKNRIKSK
jgi:hypothetical protein